VVVGIEKFREHFAGQGDQYALIGGAACDLLFAAAGLDFRATKDLDVVLCVEVVSSEFAQAFLQFINTGGYQARQRQDGHKEFYRFHEPTDKTYPYMVKLFSRHLEGLELPTEFQITKVPVDEDVISLSAILLDDEYYAALRNSRVIIDGISLLNEELLIPFKAKAFLDLTERRERGEQVDSKSVTKHRNDVFRLMQLLTAESKVAVSDAIRGDLRAFRDSLQRDDAFDPTSFGVQLSRDEGLDELARAYAL
jgi:hypothetical protein